jgi:intracellular sulfur oxidation DsrE/DsrF family protein
MSDDRGISDEVRNAFVDGQLDTVEWASVAGRLERDAALREDLGQLRELKEMVRQAYAAPPVPRLRVRRAAVSGRRYLAVAAIALAGAGWLGHAWWSGAPLFEPAPQFAARGGAQSLQGDRVLVHVSSVEHAAVAKALDEVEHLLRSARAADRGVEVEIIADHAGLALLLAGAAPATRRLAALRREYPNLSFVACGESMKHEREAGRRVELLPGTVVAPSAVEQVITRLRDGWVYVRA